MFLLVMYTPEVMLGFNVIFVVKCEVFSYNLNHILLKRLLLKRARFLLSIHYVRMTWENPVLVLKLATAQGTFDLACNKLSLKFTSTSAILAAFRVGKAVRLDPVGKLRQVMGKNWLGG